MIAKYIRDKILHGDWFIGMKIPSHRKLAEQFNVNRVTIIKSIELLESESFIFTKEGSGTYVNDYLNNHSTFNNWAQSMEWSAKSRSEYTVQLINKLETDSNFIHISKGELGKNLIPEIKLQQAMISVSKYIGDLSFGYNNGYGYLNLRKLIAKRLQEDGIDISFDNILITSGALHAIQLLTTGFLSQNATIFFNTPSYIESTHVFDSFNMKKVRIPYNNLYDFKNIIENYSFTTEGALYIEPTFNNPTGAYLPIETQKDIIKYCQIHNIPVIEDDIYRDLYFTTSPIPSMKSLDKNGNIIHISSFSKSVAPALRIGWIVASEKVIEQLADIRMQSDYGSSILSQMVIYELLKNGDFDDHVNHLRSKLKEKRDYMIEILAEHFSQTANWTVPKGGFFIWVTFNENINIKQVFFDLINKENILINPGYIYGSKYNTVRLSFAYETVENIHYALIKLKQYVNQYC